MSAIPALRLALRHCISEGITFAAFRTSGGAVTLWAQQTPELDRAESGLWWELNDVFLLSPFNAGEYTPLIRSDVELTFGDAEPHWQRLLECAGTTTRSRTTPRPTTSRAAFEAAVEQARQECAAGIVEKIVLSRTMELPVGEAEAPALFMEALHARPDAFVALVMTPDHGLWLGATPERLILAENDTVQVDAMAGTALSADAPAVPAAWGEKERHEQRVVAKSIAGTLIDLGARNITIDGPDVIAAGPVAHLRTRITANVEGRAMEELACAVHPTPAVCGIPTDKARERIAALEGRDRELYTGFWGPWSADGRMELFVNIRCMRIHADSAELHVGAGITVGSVPSNEWEETEHKADSWRQLIRTPIPA
ncbi:MAG: chorismate-binding protein [Flavobacteriales bacterium]|nr:chorismate-binding protein [Flavobacteriales bacterium]